MYYKSKASVVRHTLCIDPTHCRPTTKHWQRRGTLHYSCHGCALCQQSCMLVCLFVCHEANRNSRTRDEQVKALLFVQWTCLYIYTVDLFADVYVVGYAAQFPYSENNCTCMLTSWMSAYSCACHLCFSASLLLCCRRVEPEMRARRSGSPSTREGACQKSQTTSPRIHTPVQCTPPAIRTQTPALQARTA